MLAAIRKWRDAWARSRSALRVRGDNAAMLAMVRSFSGTSREMKAVAHELALEFAVAACPPAMVEHMLGAANVWPDVLGRKFHPNKQWALPLAWHATALCQPRPRPGVGNSCLFSPLAPLRQMRIRRSPTSARLLSQGHPLAKPFHPMFCMRSRRDDEPRSSVCAELEHNGPCRFACEQCQVCTRPLVCRGVRGSVEVSCQRDCSKSHARNAPALRREACATVAERAEAFTPWGSSGPGMGGDARFLRSLVLALKGLQAQARGTCSAWVLAPPLLNSVATRSEAQLAARATQDEQRGMRSSGLRRSRSPKPPHWRAPCDSDATTAARGASPNSARHCRTPSVARSTRGSMPPPPQLRGMVPRTH